jgi:molybdenum cofactor cytidylyltransferase
LGVQIALSIAEVRNRLPALSKRVLRDGPVVVTHHGRPESVLLSYDDFRRAARQESSGVRCAVILAAGGRDARRASELIKGARRLVRILRQAAIERIILVSDRPDSSEFNALAGVVMVPTENKNRGFASSLKRALRFVAEEHDAVLVAFASRPNVKSSTLRALYRRFEAERSKPAIVSPRYGDHRGHPLLIARHIIPQALRMDPRWGLASLIRRNATRLADVPVNDPGILPRDARP